MNVSLDVAALIGAITWPAAIIMVLFIYRNPVGHLLGSLHLTGLGIPNILSVAFEASGPNPNENQFLRASLQQHLTIEEITDHVEWQISQLLQDKTPLDYVVVDLGRDDGWLTSRLYIAALFLQKMRNLQAMVFVQTTEETVQDFIGWAEVNKVHWALAQRFGYLENAFTSAYYESVKPVRDSDPELPPTALQEQLKKQSKQLKEQWEEQLKEQSEEHLKQLKEQWEEYSKEPWEEQFNKEQERDLWVEQELGELLKKQLKEQFDDPFAKEHEYYPARLLKSIIERIQIPERYRPTDQEQEWVQIKEDKFEHAQLLTPGLLAKVLGKELITAHMQIPALYEKTDLEQARLVVSFQTARYVPLTQEDKRFERLIDRQLVLEAAAHNALQENR